MRFSQPTYRRSCLADGGRKRPGKAFLLLSGLLALFLCLGGLPSGAQAQGIPGLFSGKGSTKTETGTGAPAAETTTDGNAQPETAGSEVAPADGAGEGANLLQTVDEFTEDAVEARDVLKSIVQKIPEIQDVMVETLRAQGGERGLNWMSSTLVDILIAVVLGLVASSLVNRWGRRQFASWYQPDATTRADKIIYLYARAILMFVGVGLFFAVAAGVFLLVGTGIDASNKTALVVVGTMAVFLALRVVWLNVLAPDAESHRLLALSNQEATGLYRTLLVGSAISLAAVAFCLWMERLGLSPDIHKLALIAASALSMVILSGIAIVYRRVIARLIRGKKGAEAPIWRRVLASGWHFVAVAYFFLAWGISAVRILLDLPDAIGLVGAPLEVLLMAAVAYGLLILLIDRVLLPRLDTAAAQEKIAEDIKRAEAGEGGEEDAASTLAQARAEAAEREARRSPFRDLFDRGATILVVFTSLDMLASKWGLPLAGSGSLIGSFVEVLLVMFLGYMAYEAVKIVIDREIAKEAPAEKDEEAEVGGTGESRISTLLPIFRNFLLITIVVIATMVILSQLGVNIAPLFAGAGVVGLAVGFGAQTLIRDIFSGAFYLIDDAFRKGEYIDIGSAKGVVEKISIRSMQLRHHRGALTTVPFGEIQKVENFSRDWAVMKLAFRVTYDTDVDKMRKIIKNFGKELLEDEYYGPMFLAPLKSQGIMSMEDSAMIARVKFTTKPGKQFELRKVVYAGLRDLFEKNGIRFAHRQVTVRVAGTDDDEEAMPPAAKEAAAAGAAAAGLLGEEADGEGREGAEDRL
ncbi:mechanosensitive ion channel domain-containing protein [Roseibium aggregatum]|uniref:mechanosensitive ion channel domain-containing protein n=1 Tax=Roseibium aggregatum TaxID=187304 RepID=UPI001A90C552|nr:mechanosensitive ion channel domain-containing protein [Roseibium aggregatum]MBN8182322.1 mechanosensitive ion channel [Roseibium aggregatum]UES44140.1 mechanosensitive ion channel [Roseibium aggregatum]